jgi:hypothetical protein
MTSNTPSSRRQSRFELLVGSLFVGCHLLGDRAEMIHALRQPATDIVW